jgi:hypothetical protein
MGIQESAGFEVAGVSVFFEASRNSCHRHFGGALIWVQYQIGEEELSDVQAERGNSLVQSH